MEDWEKDLRERLDKEVSEDIYKIGSPPMIALTGKGGYINYLVEVERGLREWRDELSEDKTL